MSPLLLALLLTPSAEALTSRQSGPWVDAHVGFAAADAPLAAGLGWQAGVGWWTGRYDDAFAIGRYWAGGAVLRQDFVDGALRTAPLLEVRRGVDLLVLGWHVFLAGGPLWAPEAGEPLAGGVAIGATARGGAGLTWRRNPFLGLTVRVEAGADVVDGEVGAAIAALVGGHFARPVRAKAP